MNKLLAEFDKNDFVFPDYKNSNLSLLKGIVGRRQVSAAARKKTIFLVVDGLGYNLLVDLFMRDVKIKALFDGVRIEKRSTVFPSTTTAVMTSLETGCTPAEHGIIGWDVYRQDLGLVITPYYDSAAFSKLMKLNPSGIKSILPAPRLLIDASKRGKIIRLYPENIKSGGTFTDDLNCRNESYYDSMDMFVHLRKMIEEDGEWFIYAYYDGLDHLEHRYGFTSEQVRNWAISFFSELNRILLPELYASRYELIITADHGQMEIDREMKIDSKSGIMRCLAMPPWGDARILCMNALPGKEGALIKQFNEDYGSDAVIVESESLIKTGIFGKNRVDDAVRSRFGTHIALAKTGVTMRYGYPIERSGEWGVMKGAHSGLSEDEMEVPVITYSGRPDRL